MTRESATAYRAGLHELYNRVQDQREQWLQDHVPQLLVSAERLLKIKALVTDPAYRNSVVLVDEICEVLNVKRGSEK